MIAVFDADDYMGQRLRDLHPDWYIDPPVTTAGRRGPWTASRKHVLTGPEMTAGIRHNVWAACARVLHEKLEAQDALMKRVGPQIEAAKDLAPPPPGFWAPAYN